MIKKFTIKAFAVIAVLALYTLQFTLFIPASYAASATMSLSPASGTVNRGCTLSVEVKVDTGGADTDGTDAILFYDATRFKVTTSDIKNGTIYSDYPGNTVDPSGKITISGLAAVNQAFKGSGTLATITFAALENAPAGATQVKFDFDPNDKAKTTDSNVVERSTVQDILSQVNDATYTVGTGTGCSASSSPAPSPGGSGGTGDGAVTPTPLPTKVPVKPPPTQLPEAGDAGTTWILAAVGGILTVIGIIGLALL